MSFELVSNGINDQITDLSSEFNWSDQNALLLINFTSKNKNDVHKENPDRFGGASHQTHIDLTSGADLEVGCNPVLDFFPGVKEPKPNEQEKRTYRSRIFKSNISLLGGDSKEKGWMSSEITFLRLANVNNGMNPKAQLTEISNIKELRVLLGFNTSLVLSRGNDGVYTAFGVRTTDKIDQAMRSIRPFKRKRVFLPNADTLDTSLINDATSFEDYEDDNNDPIDENRKRIIERGATTNIKKGNTSILHEDGFVYAVINENFPGWVKVGKTIRDHTKRLKDYKTYAPNVYHFEMPIKKYVTNTSLIEKRVINALTTMGFVRDREWFKTSLKDVESIINICARDS